MDFITNFIRIDIFIGFGWYSILYFIVRHFLKERTFTEEFDKSATQVVVYGGIVWGTLWLVGTFVFYLQLEDTTEKAHYLQRWFGKHSYGIWAQPLFWITLTQLLRIPLVRRFLIFRVLISLLFVVTFERFVIFVTSMHRDHTMEGWMNIYSFDLGLNTTQIIMGFFAKILMFLITVTIFHITKGKLTGFRKQN